MNKKIGIIVGSLRRNSFSLMLAKTFLKLFPKGYEAEIIEIGDLEMYNQDLDDDNMTPKSWTRFRKQVKEKDGILFVTPEYNRSFTPAIKNAIDIGSRPWGFSVWDNKVAAIATVSAGTMGGFGANHQLRQVLVYFNMKVVQQPEFYLASIYQVFNESGEVKSPDTTKFLQSFIDSFVTLMK